jgi:hypothetical protein
MSVHESVVPVPVDLIKFCWAMRAAYLITAVFVAFGGDVVYAQPSYSCVNAEGKTVEGDQPPPECAGRRMRKLLPNGKEEIIEPDPTPEQLKKREADAKRQRDELERRREQMHSDLALLDRYRNEAEIDAARDRDLANLQARIEPTRRRIDELKRKRKTLEEEAEFFAKPDMPEELKRAFEANDAAVKSQQRTLSDIETQMEHVNERYDALVKRFRELTTKGRGQPVRPPAEKK